jgi:hypothetical protein
MTRFALLLLCLAAPLAADPAGDAWEQLSNAASALADGNPSSFLSCFDSKMPGYTEIRDDVYALLGGAQPSSSIDLDSNDGDATTREIVVDWTLNIVLAPSGPAGGPTVASTRRKQRVKIRMEKRKKKWVIVDFEPQNFFSPPETGK